MDDTFRGMTRKELADSLGVSVSAVRLYEREFGQWLQSEKGTFGRGQARTYGREDVNLFRFVRAQTKAGLSFDEVRRILESEGVPAFSEVIEEPETPPESVAGQLVPMNQYMALLARMAAAEGERNAAADEVEYLRAKVADLEHQVVAAAERAAVAETKAAVLAAAGHQPSWWQRVFGRGTTPPAGGESSE